VDADNRKFTNPLTGEPDAGNPPVRFGGRGKVNPLSLPLSVFRQRPLNTTTGCGLSRSAAARDIHVLRVETTRARAPEKARG